MDNYTLLLIAYLILLSGVAMAELQIYYLKRIIAELESAKRLE
jgi:hypothetical protein